MKRYGKKDRKKPVDREAKVKRMSERGPMGWKCNGNSVHIERCCMAWACIAQTQQFECSVFFLQETFVLWSCFIYAVHVISLLSYTIIIIFYYLLWPGVCVFILCATLPILPVEQEISSSVCTRIGCLFSLSIFTIPSKNHHKQINHD